jgi:hypothetical protein
MRLALALLPFVSLPGRSGAVFVVTRSRAANVVCPKFCQVVYVSRAFLVFPSVRASSQLLPFQYFASKFNRMNILPPTLQTAQNKAVAGDVSPYESTFCAKSFVCTTLFEGGYTHGRRRSPIQGSRRHDPAICKRAAIRTDRADDRSWRLATTAPCRSQDAPHPAPASRCCGAGRTRRAAPPPVRG